ncbi:MAG: hypothetical protein EXS55_03555 [Candidatus Magasanikbacteria bacterium]|nr:hypothetical protein [Candidatus Magasanikbacteria bacterium]
MEAVFHKSFKKKFKRLPPKIQAQFYTRLDLFLRDPFNAVLHNHSIDKAFPDCRSINITGDYRAIFQSQGELAAFITIGTHAELY